MSPPALMAAYTHDNTFLTPSQKISKNHGAAFRFQRRRIQVEADPVVTYMEKEDLQKLIKKTKQNMEKAAKDLDFIEAARIRDELLDLQTLLEEK